MGDVLLFPRSRDRIFVRKAAGWLNSHRPDAGEKYLAHLLSEHEKRLAGRGARPADIEADVASLKGAIKAATSRLNLLSQDGVA